QSAQPRAILPAGASWRAAILKINPPFARNRANHGSGRLCSLSVLRLLLQRALHLLNDALESSLVSDRKFREDFPIEFDAGGLQAFGETAVSKALCAHGGVEPLHPEHAKVAFARLAIAVGPVLGLHRRILGVAKKF